MSGNLPPEPAISSVDYIAQAGFRTAIRQYLSFSEQAARAAGITPQQYQLLLSIKGYPDGQERCTVWQLAEQLQVKSNSCVGLINRTEAQNLVRRTPDPMNRRQSYVSLTEAGEALLVRLVAVNRAELDNIRAFFRKKFTSEQMKYMQELSVFKPDTPEEKKPG